MKKHLLLLLLFLSMTVAGYSQLPQIHALNLSYIPFTPCVGAPVSFTAIDTTGLFTSANHTWNFGDGSWGNGTTLNPTVTHQYAAPGTYHVTCSAYDGLQSNFSSFDSLTIVVDSICSNHDNISGSTYYDSNGNGARDPGEPNYPNRMIEILPGPYYVTSDQNGLFSVNLTPASYTFSLVPSLYYSVTEPVGNSYTVVSAGNGSLHPGNNFGLHANTVSNDLRISLYGWWNRPGFDSEILVIAENVGTSVQNAMVTLQSDPQLIFVSADNGGTNAGNTVTWSVPSLLPGTWTALRATHHVPLTAVLYSTMTYSGIINPLAGDLVPSDNHDTLGVIVAAPFDPNAKEVSPQGQGVTGNIAPLTPLTYTIHFQNTGNLPATDVILRDTLDADLDQSTLDVIGGSHPFTWHNDFGKLSFEFLHIMLPDSNSNEPGSHGFVRYRITPKSGLAIGTELKNTASIYFDLNAPIRTNTTLNTIANLVQVKPSINTMGLSVTPNPFGNGTRFKFDNPDHDSYEMVLRDLGGRVIVQERNILGNSFYFDAGSLPSGMYLYTLQGSAGVVASGKVIKQ